MADYNVALGVKPVDIDIGKSLKTAADIQSSQAYTVNTLAEAQRKNYDLSRDEMGRAAKHLLMMPKGEARDKLYNGYVDDFSKKGYLQPHEQDYWKNQRPTDTMLQQMVTNSVSPSTSSEMSGETAGNAAATTSKFRPPEPVAPGTSLVRPNQLPGAPDPTPTMGGQALPVRPVPTQSIMPNTAAPAGNPQRATTTLDADNSRRTDSVYQEVPKLPPPEKAPNQPGVVFQGKDPAQIKADEDAVKLYEGVRTQASAATEQRATYSTLRTALENGVNTSKAGPALETMAGWMYAAGADPEKIKGWTGIDPAQADIMKKSTIQESMKFVRDTIGARESLMAINAVTSAFPNLANTKEGNLMMVNMMEQMAKYKQDASRYAGAFLEKNPGIPKSQVMDAFVSWMGQNHPLESYMSEVMPRNAPLYNDGGLDTGKLQKGSTYRVPTGKTGKDGSPEFEPGTWNGSRFVPMR